VPAFLFMQLLLPLAPCNALLLLLLLLLLPCRISPQQAGWTPRCLLLLRWLPSHACWQHWQAAQAAAAAAAAAVVAAGAQVCSRSRKQL
jgi:hypothetical protein